MSRRKPFLQRRLWSRGLPGLLLVALLGAEVVFETRYPVRVEVPLLTPKLPRGAELRILHITDVHGQQVGGHRRLVELAREARPDLIALTGDLLDSRTERPEPMWNLIDRLKALKVPLYYVTGNHEWANPLRETFEEGLSVRGVVLMNNRSEVFRKGSLVLTVSGVDDAYTGHDDLGRALSGIDPRRFTLLLSHTPAPARRLAGTPVNLMIAGHTHGGQVRLPFVGGLVAPGEGFFPEFDKGLFPLSDDQHLWVDSGVGTSLLPIRFLNRSQISLLRLTGRP